MDELKSHTRNQRRMYRIHKQEEKIHDLELLVGSLQQENQKYKEVIDKATEYINGAYEMATYTKSVVLDEENIEDLLDILKEVR